MRIRVKAVDHINLDGLTPGQLSIIIQGLEKMKAEGTAENNEVKFGLSSNLIHEISDALDEVGEIIQGPAKEARKKRKLEEAEELRKRSGVDGIMKKCRDEMAALETQVDDGLSSVGDGQTREAEIETVKEFLQGELGRDPTQQEIEDWMAPPPVLTASADKCD